MNATLLILLTIGIPWLGAAIVWLFGDKRARLTHTLAILFSALAGVAALWLIPFITSNAVLYYRFGGAFGYASFVPDAMGVTLAIIATVIGCLAVIFSVDYMHGEKSLSRYYSMVLFFIGGMAGLVLSSNMMLMFFFWEITALCSYSLISFNNDDPKAVRGGIKALLITGLGGIGLLVGALLSSTYLGSVDLPTFLTEAHGLPSGLLAAMGFGFLAAAAAKSAQFPFHTWLPDAMEAPTPISAPVRSGVADRAAEPGCTLPQLPGALRQEIRSFDGKDASYPRRVGQPARPPHKPSRRWNVARARTPVGFPPGSGRLPCKPGHIRRPVAVPLEGTLHRRRRALRTA